MKNKLNKRIGIIIILAACLLISGCPNKDDGIFLVSEEVYLMGFRLHNIDDNTPTTLNYKRAELSEYTFFNRFPGDNPYNYENAIYWNRNYWVGPYESSWVSIFFRLNAPQNKVYYMKGDKVPLDIYGRNWEFSNYFYLNYLSSTDDGEQYRLEGYREKLKTTTPPVPGRKSHFYIGNSYVPASIIVDDGYIILNDHLLRGFARQTFLVRNIFDCKQCSGPLPIPTYKITVNNGLINKGKILAENGFWNYRALNQPLEKSGNYKIIADIPSGYPIFKNTHIETSFSYNNQKSISLPILKKLLFQPRFNINSAIPISIEFENQAQITEIKKYYKTSNTKTWISINGNSITITDPKAKSIDFKFSAKTTQGTTTYEISSISLKGVELKCKPIHYYKGGNTFISGSCSSEGKIIPGLRLELYSDDKYLGAAATAMRTGKGDDTRVKGYFEFNTPGEKQNINVRFEGSGIYNPGRWNSKQG